VEKNLTYDLFIKKEPRSKSVVYWILAPKGHQLPILFILCKEVYTSVLKKPVRDAFSLLFLLYLYFCDPERENYS
jgi:hypothetical protein